MDDEARTLRYDVEERYGIKLTPDSVLWPWVVRHAAFLTARFAKRGSGTTSYQGAYGHSYTGELCPFGETVLFRIPKQSKRTHKADSAWRHGIWVGKAEESDEHLLATPDGIQRARTVRRLEPRGRADKAMLEQAVGVPWNTYPIPRATTHCCREAGARHRAGGGDRRGRPPR